jgi:hypothetical protein
MSDDATDYAPEQRLNDLTTLEALTASRDRLELQAGVDGQTQRNELNKRIFDLRQGIDARLTPPEPVPDAAAVAARDRARQEAAALHASLDAQIAKLPKGSPELERLLKDKIELYAATAPPAPTGKYTWADLHSTASTQHWSWAEKQRLQATAEAMGLAVPEAIQLAAGLEDHRGLSAEALAGLQKITVPGAEAAAIHQLFARLPAAEQERLNARQALRSRRFVDGMRAAVRRMGA